MSDPRPLYESRLQRRKQDSEAIRVRYDWVAWSRLGTFLVSLVVTILTWRLSLGTPGIIIACCAFALFLALVVIHPGLARKHAQAQAAIAWYRRALDRLSGKWTAFPERGDRFQDDQHPYALDLDIFGQNSLFQYLNDTRTHFGERTLSSWLSEPASPTAIVQRQESLRELSQKHDLREALFVAGSCDAENLPEPGPLISWCEQGAQPKLNLGVLLLSWLLPCALSTVLIAGSVANFVAWPAFPLFLLNLLVLQLLRNRLQPAIVATTSRSEELERYSGILALIEREPFDSPALRALADRLRASGAPASLEIHRLARLVSMLEARQNGVFRVLVGPALLWDIHWVSAIEAWQRRVGKAARVWLETIGEFEALASFGTFSFEHPAYALPTIDQEELTFQARGLGHPLLEQEHRVLNDLELPGAGGMLLVTGSNMSGKSTLLRSIGVAAVLALAGAPVCATELRIGLCSVRTSMRVSDSLRDGISRFYAELLKLKGVVDAAQGTTPVLFLLDEILHGTNSRERHLGARSIVRKLLALGASGAVSTHDLALAELEQSLPGKVRNVHFEEQVVGENMTFDYHLREGVVRSGNALRWMRHLGLEVEEE